MAVEAQASCSSVFDLSGGLQISIIPRQRVGCLAWFLHRFGGKAVFMIETTNKQTRVFLLQDGVVRVISFDSIHLTGNHPDLYPEDPCFERKRYRIQSVR